MVPNCQRDPYLQSIYLRTAPNSHPYPANPSTGGWSRWTGCCGIYSGVLLMFGRMEPGAYRYEWFNPAKGESGETGSVNASAGPQQFKAQFESDAVLWLERTSTPD